MPKKISSNDTTIDNHSTIANNAVRLFKFEEARQYCVIALDLTSQRIKKRLSVNFAHVQSIYKTLSLSYPLNSEERILFSSMSESLGSSNKDFDVASFFTLLYKYAAANPKQKIHLNILQFFNFIIDSRCLPDFPDNALKAYFERGHLYQLIKVMVDLEFDIQNHLISYLKHEDVFSSESTVKLAKKMHGFFNLDVSVSSTYMGLPSTEPALEPSFEYKM